MNSVINNSGALTLNTDSSYTLPRPTLWKSKYFRPSHIAIPWFPFDIKKADTHSDYFLFDSTSF